MNVIFNPAKYKSEMISEKLLRYYEKEQNIEFLFGGTFGKIVYETGSPISDIDYKFVHKKCAGTAPSYARLFDEESLNDIITVDVDYVIDSTTSYLYKYNLFPTVLFRNNNDIEVSIDYQREDYYLSYFFEILESDFIYGKDYLSANYNRILSTIRILGLCDYYYTRAYMHYKKTIKEGWIRNDKVSVKAILSCFMNLSIIDYLIENRTLPCPVIRTFMERCESSELISFINLCLEIQKGIVKKELEAKISVNRMFFEWVQYELNKNANVLKNFPREECVQLGRDSLLSKYIKENRENE